jgi:hypothetical protein
VTRIEGKNVDMNTDDERGGMPDLVTFTEIAQRLTERGIIEGSITRQGVRHIADTDPDWPIPPEHWIKAGRAFLMHWDPVEKFFREREKPRRRGPGKKSSPEPGGAEKPEQ